MLCQKIPRAIHTYIHTYIHTLTQSPFRFIGLAMLIAALAMTTQAKAQSPQTTDIGANVTVNGSVYGNGSGPNNINPPSSPPSTSTSSNTVNVNNGGTVTVSAYGAYSGNAAPAAVTASDNKIIVGTGGTVGLDAVGGFVLNSAGAATASSNTASVSGKVDKDVLGGSAYGMTAATVTDNTADIDGATVSGNIYGGYASQIGINGTAIATDNTVNITGGAVNGNIYGGYANATAPVVAATATGNTVTINGGTFGASSVIYGGFTSGTGAGDAFTGNTLNLHTSSITVAGVYNFENLNFFLPSTLTASTTPLLTVTGTANLTNGSGSTAGTNSSIVNVSIDGASSLLQAGDSIVLIDAATLVTNSGLNTKANGTQGVSLKYEFDISTSGNQLLATVRDAGPSPSPTLNPQTKSFSEARLSQLAFSNQGADLIAGQGLFAALDATAAGGTAETTTFGMLSGGTSRYKTGSHSDVSGVSLIAGLAFNSRLTLGKLTLGEFFEYGNANYDSYNSFINAASVHGKGGLDYTGGGILAHFEFNPTATGNAWLESSTRFGEASVNFQTGDMGRHAAFASDSNYAAAHVGLGYHWNLTKRKGLDFYAQYLWSRQNADSVELTTGETVNFEAANSERLRLGSRFVYAMNTYRRAYAGIAWEHEFDGEADASILGYRLDTPKLTGDTCKLELGYTLLPSKTCRFTRNFGLQGYAGKREGAAGSVEIRYEF
ncbi:membrane protein [Planctomycetales bacterium]|nr:membrane protein [Planctomycetales bacterium]